MEVLLKSRIQRIQRAIDFEKEDVNVLEKSRKWFQEQRPLSELYFFPIHTFDARNRKTDHQGWTGLNIPVYKGRLRRRTQRSNVCELSKLYTVTSVRWKGMPL